MQAALESYTARIEALSTPGNAEAGGVDEEEQPWMAERTQKALTHKATQADASALWKALTPPQKANMQAQQAPGAGSWMQPAPTADIMMTDGQFATSLALRLGVSLERAQPLQP